MMVTLRKIDIIKWVAGKSLNYEPEPCLKHTAQDFEKSGKRMGYQSLSEHLSKFIIITWQEPTFFYQVEFNMEIEKRPENLKLKRFRVKFCIIHW